MPELPEVETIRRGLESHITNQKIVDIEVRNPSSFHGDVSKLVGQKVKSVSRRGKHIICDLDNNCLMVHLKMTGQLIYIPDGDSFHVVGGHPDKNYSLDLPHKHSHVIIKLDNGTLYFNDLRKFGWIKSFDSIESAMPSLDHLGPEYSWSDFSLDYFKEKLSRKSITIKRVLLDQTIVSGLGNIYADEALFLSGIDPRRSANSLSEAEITKLYMAIPKVLDEALSHGGTTMKDFRHTDGSLGSYLVVAKVYGREGEPCKICQTNISRIKISGRSSHFCTNCQC